MKRAVYYAMIALLLTAGSSFGQSISLDHVDGLVNSSTIGIDQPVTFHLRVTNLTDTSFDGMANGFSVYSSDGAEWTTTTHDTTGTLGMAQFDGGVFFPKFSIDGQGADTVGFGCLRFFSTGMPGGFDDVAFTVTIGPVAAEHVGKTICLDSAFYPPSGVWKWAASGSIDVFPAWSGPHCWTVGGPPTGDSLLVWPPALEFYGAAGANIVLTDSLMVESNGAPLSYAVQVDSVPWLGVSSPGGTTPGMLSVTASAFNLGGGTYSSTIRIFSGQADNSPLAVPVVFHVRPDGPAIVLDHVDGNLGPNRILANEEVTFYLRFIGSEYNYDGIINGLRVHSPDGALWTTSSMDTTGTIGMQQFDLGVFFSQFSVTGSAADTLGFGAVKLAGSGLVPGFDDVALTVQIGPIDSASVDRTICLDSAWFPPTGEWGWYAPSHGLDYPAWDGPHCFTVAPRPPSDLVVTPPELHFTKVQLEADPPPQPLFVGSTSPVPDGFSVNSDSPWLTTSIWASQTPDSVMVMVQADGMDVGDYLGHLTFESPTAQNSPVIVPVHLSVLPGLTDQPFDINVQAFTSTQLEDWTAHFGVNSDATDGFDPLLDELKAPPPPGDFVQVYFPHPEWNQFSDDFATDYRSFLQQECKEWHMVVHTNHATTVDLNCVGNGGTRGYTISLFNDLGMLLSEDFLRFGYQFNTTGGETHFTIRVCDYPVYYGRYLAGWSLMSSPLELRDPTPAAVIGDDAPFWQLYGWDGAYFAPSHLQGRTEGYWLLLPQATTVDFEGAVPQPPDSMVCSPLDRGWNLIGCPFMHPIDVNDIMIDSSGYQLPFYDAAAAGWISPVFYAWSGSFYFNTPLLGPGFGYWFAALIDGLQLCYYDTGPAAIASDDAGSRPTTALTQAATIIKLTCGDGTVAIGLAADAHEGFDPRYDLPAPPLSPTGTEATLRLLADHADGFDEYTQDVRGLDREVTWSLHLARKQGQKVSITGLAALQELGYQIELVGVDQEFAQVVYSDGELALAEGDYRLVARQSAEPSDLLPERFYLAANYPNPFNPRTTIAFGLPEPVRVRLTIYNVLGQEVTTLIDESRSAGRYEEAWDGRDYRGRAVSSGIYLYRLEAGEFYQTRKMLLVK